MRKSNFIPKRKIPGYFYEDEKGLWFWCIEGGIRLKIRTPEKNERKRGIYDLVSEQLEIVGNRTNLSIHRLKTFWI